MDPNLDPPGSPPRFLPAEVNITRDLVRALLRSQHPDIAELELFWLENGWDNVTFRLGKDLAVRLPRRRLAVDLLEKEQRWLDHLAPGLPLPIPVPLRIGRPTAHYPWPWSVVPWIGGEAADQATPAPDQSFQLGRFLRALHRPAPADAPHNEFRGGPLSLRTVSIEARLARVGSDDLGVAVEEMWRAWEYATQIPIDVANSWIHGDLHPRNVIVSAGTLAAVR